MGIVHYYNTDDKPIAEQLSGHFGFELKRSDTLDFTTDTLILVGGRYANPVVNKLTVDGILNDFPNPEILMGKTTIQVRQQNSMKIIALTGYNIAETESAGYYLLVEGLPNVDVFEELYTPPDELEEIPEPLREEFVINIRFHPVLVNARMLIEQNILKIATELMNVLPLGYDITAYDFPEETILQLKLEKEGTPALIGIIPLIVGVLKWVIPLFGAIISLVTIVNLFTKKEETKQTVAKADSIGGISELRDKGLITEETFNMLMTGLIDVYEKEQPTGITTGIGELMPLLVIILAIGLLGALKNI